MAAGKGAGTSNVIAECPSSKPFVNREHKRPRYVSISNCKEIGRSFVFKGIGSELSNAISACRPSRSRLICASTSSPGGCVLNSLTAGPTVLKGHITIVPILDPATHQLPFGVALELHTRAQAESAQPSTANASPANSNKEIYELHFVLDGEGCLIHPSGQREELHAGDTLLMTAGTAAASAGKAPAAAARIGAEATVPWDFAKLVVYMPKSLVDLARDGASGEPHSHIDEANRGLIAGFTRQQWDGGAAASGLPEEVVSRLLSGAKRVAKMTASNSQGEASSADEMITDQDHGSQSAAWLPGLEHVWQAFRSALADAWHTAAAGGKEGDPLPLLLKRTMSELSTFRLPNQTNRLALVFDPMALPPVPFVFGVEIFEQGHKTTPHVHPTAHEVFFILAGQGEAFCGKERFPIGPGDIVAFRPGATHGIDCGNEGRIYCLELMLPNEQFAEFVRAGQPTGGLEADDLCMLAKLGCG